MAPFDPGPAAFPKRLLGLIRDALDEDGFVVLAQPIVDLVSGEPLKHELTLALPGDDGQPIPPAGFVPAAHWFGLATELDDLLIRRAVGLARRGDAVAVGVGAAARSDPDLARRTQRAVIDGQIDPALLTFELAETGLAAHTAGMTALVQRVHELGCPVTISHFGGGYAGFGYLKALAVDCLKIDVDFLADEPTSSEEQFLRAFIDLARGLGMTAAAGGVSSAAVRVLLEDLGLDQAQGAIFGEPSPLAQGDALPGPVLAGGHDGR